MLIDEKQKQAYLGVHKTVRRGTAGLFNDGAGSANRDNTSTHRLLNQAARNTKIHDLAAAKPPYYHHIDLRKAITRDSGLPVIGFRYGTISHSSILGAFWRSAELCILGIEAVVFLSSAQNPVSDMGSWPDGAVTLFGGLYCALHSMSYYNYDVLPPICLAPVWHMIPGLKDRLRGSGKMGSWFNMLVLGCKERSGVNIREEWDAVIVPAPNPNPTIDQRRMVFTAESQGKVKAVITVVAGDPDIDVKFEEFHRVTSILFGGGGLPDQDASNLMRRWHAMKQYLTTRQAGMVPSGFTNDFEELQRHWMEKMTGIQAPQNPRPGSQPPPGLDRLSKQSVTVFFPEAPCRPGELAPNAGIDETSVTLADLAIMLAYNKALIRERAAPGNTALAKRSLVVNPLLPCLWLWKENKLDLTNNLCITFPPAELFPVTDEGRNGTRIDVLLDLHPQNGYQEWEVDGFNIYGFGNLPWFLGTLCSCVISFFVSVASNSTPTLSAAIALYFSIPYSCDNNHRDMGWPPSWNGRVRLRWGDPDPSQGYACGIFSGAFRKRMGKTGTSIPRATLVLLVCVLSWTWKSELRTALGFQNSGVSRWVQMVGGTLETFVTISALFSFPILFAWKMNKHAFICIAGSLFAVANTVLMWLWIFRGIGLLPLRILGELGAMVLFSVFSSAQLVGIGYVNGATTLFVVYSWFHYVAISCVLGDSRA
ncbi:hypothetical protein HOY82DRAFT_590806 [Tuber indicum]|nr:hypothetical protein HOY82DRAFT_590806 [Tuber indicum]